MAARIVLLSGLEIAPSLLNLYRYLVERGCIVQLDNYDPECLLIFSRDVLVKHQEWRSFLGGDGARLGS